MEGYFKPKAETKPNQIRALDLSDCEFVPDDEVNPSIVYGRKHVCPRCGTVSRIMTDDPYCSECNWDSLLDPCCQGEQ